MLMLLSLSRVRVIVDDGVGAEVGIAVGGGAYRVDNADGVVAVAVAVVVGVVVA
jgi:hypothetical protein